MKWTYNPYIRVMLRRNGKLFAIVTRDGKNALSKRKTKTLLDALNASTSTITVRWQSGQKTNAGNWQWVGNAGDELNRLLNKRSAK